MADLDATDRRDLPTRVHGQAVGVHRNRTVPYYVLGDASRSMEGIKIAQANAALSEIVPVLQERESALRVNFEVRLLRVGGNAEWATDATTRPHDFRPPRLDAAGRTPLGAAFDLLAVEMGQLAARHSQHRDVLTPALLLISDGRPTDDYAEPLARFLATAPGRASRRAAIAIGDDCDRAMLERFTGSAEMVFDVTELFDIAATIQKCTMMLSRFAATGVPQQAADGAGATAGGVSADYYSQFVAGLEG